LIVLKIKIISNIFNIEFTEMKIIHAESTLQIEEIRKLFREYQRFLNVDLCFQSFEEELASLPGKYSPPKGSLLLAVENEKFIGCVALRKLEDNICEMKRLYVKPEYRGKGFGKVLAEEIIEEAKKIGYSFMRLDTLTKLNKAMNLYRTLGFKKIKSYYSNPLDEVVYWELELKKDLID